MQEETLLIRCLIEVCPCQGNMKTDAKIPLFLSKILNRVILTRKHFFLSVKKTMTKRQLVKLIDYENRVVELGGIFQI